jgi:hypothetical protein
MKFQVDEMSSWWNVKLMKSLVDEMSIWRIDMAPNARENVFFPNLIETFYDKVWEAPWRHTILQNDNKQNDTRRNELSQTKQSN